MDFAFSCDGSVGQPRDVPSGPCQALDKTSADRIARGCHDNGNCPGRLLRRANRRRRRCHDHVDFQVDEVRCHLIEPLVFPVREAPLDGQIRSLHVSEFTQPLEKRFVTAASEESLLRTTSNEDANAPDLGLLLSQRGDGGREHA